MIRLKPLWWLVIVPAFVLWLFYALLIGRPAPAAMAAPPGCVAGEAAEKLLDSYKMVSVVWAGLRGDNVRVRLHAGSEGWAALVIYPDGRACLAAAGREWWSEDRAGS